MNETNGYVSVWKNTIGGILTYLNDHNVDLSVPGRVYELVQILRQPTDLDTPGGMRTEGWIGIIKITTPADALQQAEYLPNKLPGVPGH